MTLRLIGDGSGFTEIKAPTAAGDNSITLPTSNGSANQLLQNSGTAGELQYTSAGEGLHYDSSGRLLVGTSSARGVGHGTAGAFEIEGTSATVFASVVKNSADQYGSSIALGKSRGAAFGANTAVQSGDELGSIRFAGADGTDVQTRAAQITAVVDGTPGPNVMPGKISFSTNGGGSSPTPRVEIGSNGALKLLAGCPGIDFSGIQTNASGVSSEQLDSYEEGSWTPSLNGGTVSSSVGKYTKIGRLVVCHFNLAGLSSAITGDFINGLPFAASTVNQIGIANIGDVSGVTYSSGYGDIYGRVNGGESRIQLLQRKTDGFTHTSGVGLSTSVVLRGHAYYFTPS